MAFTSVDETDLQASFSEGFGRSKPQQSLTKSTDNLERAPIDEPIGCGITGSSTNAPMTDPKNPEAQNEELDLEELKKQLVVSAIFLVHISEAERQWQPGGTSFPKTKLGGECWREVATTSDLYRE